MLTRQNRRQSFGSLALLIVLAVGFLGLSPLGPQHAYGAELLQRSLTTSDSGASATQVTYAISFRIMTLGTLGSLEFQFCANDPFIGDPCTAPTGLNTLNTHITDQTGQTGFAINGNSTINDLILSRAPSVAGMGTVSYAFDNITNPDTTGSYYLRVLTYSSSDGSGAPTDTGALAFAINQSINVSAQVPPYLLLCTGTLIVNFDCSTASGDYIDFGDLGADHTSAADTQIVVATNAQNGYGMWVLGTTLTAGNNTIPAMSSLGTSQLGVSQFGLNLTANTLPQVGQGVQGPGVGQPTASYGSANHYRFVPGAQIANVATADDYRKYTVSYIVNVAKSQAPGVYVTTLTYLVTANF